MQKSQQSWVNPGILPHSEIWGAAIKAVLNDLKKSPKVLLLKKKFMEQKNKTVLPVPSTLYLMDILFIQREAEAKIQVFEASLLYRA